MKLDPRIILLTDIITCFDTDSEKARKTIGKKGYFSFRLGNFYDLSTCDYGTLDLIDTANRDDDHSSDDVFHQKENDCYYSFFIPECLVKPKEKNYRPYTLNEFLDKYIICANIRIRQRDRTCQYFGKLIGYEFPTDPNTGKQKRDNDAIVCIGGYNFKLIELFTDYEQYDNMKDIWVPCGVEVENGQKETD